MSLKSNQEVFICRGSEATQSRTAGLPLMHPVLRWFWFDYKKILPTGEYPEELLEHICFYPRRWLSHSPAKPSITRGWLEWMLPAEVMSGLKRTQVPSSSSSTTSTPLAGTSCASCSPSCRDKAQLGTELGSCRPCLSSQMQFSLKISSCTKIPHPAGEMTEFGISLKSWKFGKSCKCYKSEFSAKLSLPLGVPWLLHKGSKPATCSALLAKASRINSSWKRQLSVQEYTDMGNRAFGWFKRILIFTYTQKTKRKIMCKMIRNVKATLLQSKWIF